MIADEGAASAAGLLRGDVISSIGGVPMEAPHHAAETLRQSEGYVHLGVLYPFASMDLSVEANESKPIVSPRQSIGAGKPILGGSSDGSAMRHSIKLGAGGDVVRPGGPAEREGASARSRRRARGRLDLSSARRSSSPASPESPRTLSARAKASGSAVLNSPRALAHGVADTVRAPFELRAAI